MTWSSILLGTILSAATLTEAQYDERVKDLREKVAGYRFTIVVQPPFVVIGDEEPVKVKERAARTVQWTIEHLRKDFFAEDPKEIIDIWIFKNEKSYRLHAKRLFGDEPDTPYGYYSAANHALVMNIGPGYGTLVHELVHPYMHTNFPDCPPWLNEGLASLYEQPAERKGQIIGNVNWRLPILAAAIRAKRLPSFEKLLALEDREFYEDDRGTNYAQARYLIYALQEKGLLVRFVKEARAAHAADPTGYLTLKRLLGDPDMAAFQRAWEKDMLQLDAERRRKRAS